MTNQNNKLEIELDAETPIIHFQWEQDGATLRASEVKPKLDRFLKQKIDFPDDKSVYLKDTDALNYKMKIERLNPKSDPIIELDDYKIYYGNMGGNIKKGVLDDIKVTIICFHEKLLRHISENIQEFFLITNFGTMQGKGFGSFCPKDFCVDNTLDETQITTIGKYLASNVGTDTFFYFNDTGSNVEKFKKIKDFYWQMKTGRGDENPPYIYRYFSDKYGSEKAYLKSGIEGVLRLPRPVPLKSGVKYRYLRSVLGICDSVYFRHVKTNVRIRHKEKKIERFNSTIFFKIIKDTVFVAGRPLDEKMKNQRFEFSSGTRDNPKPVIINTPDDFDTTAFLKEYVEFYNQKNISIQIKTMGVND